jgi:hypothetical protein
MIIGRPRRAVLQDFVSYKEYPQIRCLIGLHTSKHKFGKALVERLCIYRPNKVSFALAVPLLVQTSNDNTGQACL